MKKVETLQELVPRYAHSKQEADSYKKLAEQDNAEIKSIMLKEKLDTFTAGGWTASCTVSEKEALNEEGLIAYLKKNKVKGLIKKREYIDMDALESAIYKGEIDAAALAPYQEKKEVVTLRIKKERS